MTTLDHTAFPMTTRAPRWTVVMARAVNAVARLALNLKNRREIYRLGELSDTELADIGLTRADLHIVARSPMGTDPTARLGAFAEARSIAMENLARRVC